MNLLSSSIWTHWLVILLYWLPLILCSYYYTLVTVREYNAELVRSTEPYYYPTMTIGTLIGRLLLTVVPITNLFAAVADVVPAVFGNFSTLVRSVLNTPLVPPRKPK